MTEDRDDSEGVLGDGEAEEVAGSDPRDDKMGRCKSMLGLTRLE